MPDVVVSARREGGGEMRWVRDGTGRYRWRPFLDASEIDVFCERRIQRFLFDHYGDVAYPLSTDDLTRLIEQDVDDLDLFADLSTLGDDSAIVEGVTTFVPGRRPSVQIARQLSEDPRQEARLRTTLAHELGHVLLHDFTGEREDAPRPRQADDPDTATTTWCTPWVIGTGSRVDWMEWQANYASGALLMPRAAVWQAMRPFVEDESNTAPPLRACLGPMVDWMQGHFLVSEAAAYVRLRQLRYLPGTGSLPLPVFDTPG